MRRLAQRALDLVLGHTCRQGLHPVLQLGQLIGDIGRQQVAARRKHLSELDEDWSEILQCAAHADRARLGRSASGGPADDAHERRAAQAGDCNLVQAIAPDDGQDA